MRMLRSLKQRSEKIDFRFSDFSEKQLKVLLLPKDKNDERAVEAIAEIVPTYHPDEKNRPDNKAELLQKNENQAAG